MVVEEVVGVVVDEGTIIGKENKRKHVGYTHLFCVCAFYMP